MLSPFPPLLKITYMDLYPFISLSFILLNKKIVSYPTNITLQIYHMNIFAYLQWTWHDDFLTEL